VRYELGFYIPEDDIIHSHRRDNLKSYVLVTSGSVRRVLTDAPSLCPSLLTSETGVSAGQGSAVRT
jgi:hypothetical protein